VPLLPAQACLESLRAERETMTPKMHIWPELESARPSVSPRFMWRESLTSEEERGDWLFWSFARGNAHGETIPQRSHVDG